MKLRQKSVATSGIIDIETTHDQYALDHKQDDLSLLEYSYDGMIWNEFKTMFGYPIIDDDSLASDERIVYGTYD